MTILVTIRLDTPEHADPEIAARLRRMREWTTEVGLFTPSGAFPAYVIGIERQADDENETR